MLDIGVHKVAGARAHEYEDRNQELGFSGSEQIERRRRAAFSKIGAELDAVSTALSSSEGGVQRLNGGFDQHPSNTSRHNSA